MFTTYWLFPAEFCTLNSVWVKTWAMAQNQIYPHFTPLLERRDLPATMLALGEVGSFEGIRQLAAQVYYISRHICKAVYLFLLVLLSLHICTRYCPTFVSVRWFPVQFCHTALKSKNNLNLYTMTDSKHCCTNNIQQSDVLL